MTRDLTSSAVAAIDEFHQIVSLQQLLEISLEQLEQASQTPKQRRARTELLLICYLHQVKPCLENLEAELREIQQQAASLKDSHEVRHG